MFLGGTIASAYVCTKFEYHQYLLEKHLALFGFWGFAGVTYGHFAMQFPIVKQRYMEFFAIVGYALFYISAFILKTEYER